MPDMVYHMSVYILKLLKFLNKIKLTRLKKNCYHSYNKSVLRKDLPDPFSYHSKEVDTLADIANEYSILPIKG